MSSEPYSNHETHSCVAQCPAGEALALSLATFLSALFFPCSLHSLLSTLHSLLSRLSLISLLFSLVSSTANCLAIIEIELNRSAYPGKIHNSLSACIGCNKKFKTIGGHCTNHHSNKRWCHPSQSTCSEQVSSIQTAAAAGLDPNGRCGPNYGDTACATAAEPYCNENNGLCGSTAAHMNAQASEAYDYCGPSSTVMLGESGAQQQKLDGQFFHCAEGYFLKVADQKCGVVDGMVDLGGNYPAGSSVPESKAACAKACDDRSGCTHYTWFSDRSCRTFTSCNTLNPLASSGFNSYICEKSRLGNSHKPCPATFPHLEQWQSSGVWFCYKSAGNGGGVCSYFGNALAPNGGSWGRSQGACPGN